MVTDLIYDVGAHDGDDTAYYLYRGYRVLAIEADPTMVEACKKRFRDEIQKGRLVLLNAGIAASRGAMRFWLHKHSPWSSFRWNSEWSPEGCESIEVTCVPFADVLSEYGVPYYLKVDIEGADGLCLRDLNATDLPEYVSFEAGPTSFYGACFLASLGYNAFKLVDQTTHSSPNTKYSNEVRLQRWSRKFASWKWSVTKRLKLDASFAGGIWRARRKLIPLTQIQERPRSVAWHFGPHSSGPFGNDTPGSWLSLEAAAYDWLHRRFKHTDRGTLSQNSWYDWHVTRIEGFPSCATFFHFEN